MNTLSRLAVSASLLGLVLALLTAPANAAAASYTVSGRIVDKQGNPIEGITVEAYIESDRYDNEVSFYETDADGVFSRTTTNTTSAFRTGTWTLDVYDEREGVDIVYTGKEVEFKIAGPGQTTVPDITLETGAIQAGNLYAPSGKPLANVLVAAHRANVKNTYDNGDITSAKGRFVVGGLQPARYDFRYLTFDELNFEGEDDEDVFRAARKLPGSGRTYTTDQVAPEFTFRNVKIRCDSGLFLSSPSKGKVKIVIKSTAAENGIRKPGGRVTLARNGKVIRNFSWSDASKTITLAHQSKGKKFTYKVVYNGGDCFKWSSTKKVTVKK